MSAYTIPKLLASSLTALASTSTFSPTKNPSGKRHL